MTELLYTLIPLGIVVLIAIAMSIRESRPKSLEESIGSFRRSAQALAGRSAREQGLRTRR